MTTAEAALAGELDGYLTTRQVELLTGYSRRWLSELIDRGDFPPPDVRGGLGASHRWRCSTIKKALDKMQSAKSATGTSISAYTNSHAVAEPQPPGRGLALVRDAEIKDKRFKTASRTSTQAPKPNRRALHFGVK